MQHISDRELSLSTLVLLKEWIFMMFLILKLLYIKYTKVISNWEMVSVPKMKEMEEFV